MANGVAQAFDIFSFSEKFEKVGFPKDQIRVIIEAISASRSNPEAVSHAELREHKAEVKAEAVKVESNIEKHESKVLHAISDLRKDMDSKMEIMKRDIIIRITGVVITVVIGTAGLVLAGIKLLF